MLNKGEGVEDAVISANKAVQFDFYMSMDSQWNGLSTDMQHWLIG